jgi:hypothetical protein
LVLYVDRDATGANDGTSWSDAFTDLQDALTVAANPGSGVGQVWVGAGTYVPDRGTGDRTATFALPSNVALFGGFAGGETGLAQRDPATNETVLSGDIGVAGAPQDNTFHVVTASGTGILTLLDGFTVTGGHANGGWTPNTRGAGIYNAGGQLTVRNCLIQANVAVQHGGGMSNSDNADPLVIDCAFRANSAGVNGGGVRNRDATGTFISCDFVSNFAQLGGGMRNLDAHPYLEDCRFLDNRAAAGGGMFNGRSDATLFNCLFGGNATTLWAGGAMNNDDSAPSLVLCTLSGNEAVTYGGGLHNKYGTMVSLRNCVLWNNTASTGQDRLAQINNVTGSISSVDYCCVQEWTHTLTGMGNIAADPLFVPGPQGSYYVSQTEAGQTQQSPCVNAGDPTAPLIIATTRSDEVLDEWPVDMGYHYAAP